MSPLGDVLLASAGWGPTPRVPGTPYVPVASPDVGRGEAKRRRSSKWLEGCHAAPGSRGRPAPTDHGLGAHLPSLGTSASAGGWQARPPRGGGDVGVAGPTPQLRRVPVAGHKLRGHVRGLGRWALGHQADMAMVEGFVEGRPPAHTRGADRTGRGRPRGARASGPRAGRSAGRGRVRGGAGLGLGGTRGRRERLHVAADAAPEGARSAAVH